MRHATTSLRRFALVALTLVAGLGLGGCGYNDFQRLDEGVKAAWSEVLNQYQRRADLIPNLVSTVKGEANFEQETLTKVIEARSRATAIQATPELVNDPEAFDKFQKAQGELSGALSRLLVVAEQYPNLRANQAFQDLRVAARRHREPDHRRAQPLHPDRGRIQRHGAELPDQPHGDDVRLQGQAELHGRRTRRRSRCRRR